MSRTVPLFVLLLAGCWRAPPPVPQAVAADGLHNVFRLTPALLSGSGPDGDAGFASLRKLGVKTVVSVDGAAPDVDAAARHGLRYVHLPVGYDGVPRDTALRLARAVRDLPGPVYVHCHHGKHRGPAAAAAIRLCLDPAWTPEEAAAWLRAAGTDPRYAGLVGLPASLARPTEAELNAVPASFPAVSVTNDLTRGMVAVDEAWDRLKAAKQTGWKTGAADATLLTEHYREAARTPDAKRRGGDFLRELGVAERAAADLDRALRASDAPATAAAFAASGSACGRCHARFRD